jgi:hypothetical protein
MLEAKKLQLETEGVTVHDSEFNCGLRFFRDTGLSMSRQPGASTVTGTRKVGAVEAPAVWNERQGWLRWRE